MINGKAKSVDVEQESRLHGKRRPRFTYASTARTPAAEQGCQGRGGVERRSLPGGAALLSQLGRLFDS